VRFFDARRVVQLVALLLAVAAAAVLIGVPMNSGSTTQTLLRAEGPHVLPVLLLPVALTLVPATWLGRGRTAAAVACAVLLVLVCLAGLLTVGVFYLPAAIVSGVAFTVPARGAIPASSTEPRRA
jgi:hypothetical protein